MSRALVVYDIADNLRRATLSALLTEYRPRVQLSVFEIELPTAADRVILLSRIRAVIDRREDQVRIYEMPVHATSRTIIGERVLEERRGYYIV
ncbi:CRISPR-associated endonuclease Cas2 [Nocardia sp. NPDC058705]|uniref:CRISPR-associated endonuclease Cas2 n=1 Tax=Nocardia sp. NPDC058705 TaxID=3346609 RepID=UPI0036C87B8B